MFLIVLSLALGLVVGLIVWLFTNLLTGLIVWLVTAVVLFVSLLALGIYFSMAPTPENAVIEFTNWLESPFEYGEKPDSCEVVFHEKLPWPMSGAEKDVFLCRYEYEGDGEDADDEIDGGIGLAWPTCWTLIGLDQGFTFDEMVSCYRGWYVLASKQKAGWSPDELTRDDWAPIAAHLQKQGFEVTGDEYSSSQIMKTPEGAILFAVQVVKDGKPTVVVGDSTDFSTIETRDIEKFGVPVAHYHWLDSWWLNSIGLRNGG